MERLLIALSWILTVVKAPPPVPSPPLIIGAPAAPGSSFDAVCLASAGYSWCASTQSCVRQWETPCKDNYANCRECLQSQRDGFNIACPSHCDVDSTEDACTCPPAPPCPLALAAPRCRQKPVEVDTCGCPIACPGFECTRGAECGGFAGTVCTEPFECVATMGPLVADAPGTCVAPCATARDAYGNCIDPGCVVWHDGCNTCHVGADGGALACTEMMCYDVRYGAGHCVDDTESSPAGKGEVCHRFCEDGSELPVHRECSRGLSCIAPGGVGFDSCGERASRCAAPTGH